MHSASKLVYVSHPTKQVNSKLGDVDAELFVDCRPTEVSTSRGASNNVNGASLAYFELQLWHGGVSKLVVVLKALLRALNGFCCSVSVLVASLQLRKRYKRYCI